METAFKILLRLLFTAVWAWSIHWLWTSQIDPRATVRQWAGKAFEPPTWVATRDATRLYQDGVAVAEVTGDVTEGTTTVRFAQLANAGALKRGDPVEWQRYRLRIVEVQATLGMKSVVTEKGSQVLMNVIEGVTCEIIH